MARADEALYSNKRAGKRPAAASKPAKNKVTV